MPAPSANSRRRKTCLSEQLVWGCQSSIRRWREGRGPASSAAGEQQGGDDRTRPLRGVGFRSVMRQARTTTQESGQGHRRRGLDRVPPRQKGVAWSIPRLVSLTPPPNFNTIVVHDASRVSRDSKAWGSGGASYRRQLTGRNLAQPVKQTETQTRTQMQMQTLAPFSDPPHFSIWLTYQIGLSFALSVALHRTCCATGRDDNFVLASKPASLGGYIRGGWLGVLSLASLPSQPRARVVDLVERDETLTVLNGDEVTGEK
ncbi:hypothetical protein G7Z17_g12745 [Cylindrodendrum hubeiense]|uniref:Uncharacterized protein n=1 Tax=Cylindrodendrum hubeiense TaxID=595255 RepID=A0A9P5H0B1_9HYPO|nr:hypothetical protein G7Z17_g12745 [Cylindrodendrum hubeiense]